MTIYQKYKEKVEHSIEQVGDTTCHTFYIYITEPALTGILSIYMYQTLNPTEEEIDKEFEKSYRETISDLQAMKNAFNTPL